MAHTGANFGLTLGGPRRGQAFAWHADAPREPHWVQLELTHAAEAWLLNRAGIDPTALQALVAEGARPRCANFEDGVMVVLRGVNTGVGTVPEDMVSVRMWIQRERIVTVTPRHVKAIGELRDQLETGRGPASPAALVVAMADRMLAELHPIVVELDEETDRLQERLVADDLAGFRIDLARLRRRLIQFRKHLAPQREALHRLWREQSGLFADDLHEQLREVSERTAKHVDDVVAMAERATVMHDELESRLNERMSRNMQFMSLVAVMFLPLSFLTSLLGINVGGIPWAGADDGFLRVCIVLAALMLGQVLVLRRLRLFRSL